MVFWSYSDTIRSLDEADEELTLDGLYNLLTAIEEEVKSSKRREELYESEDVALSLRNEIIQCV